MRRCRGQGTEAPPGWRGTRRGKRLLLARLGLSADFGRSAETGEGPGHPREDDRHGCRPRNGHHPLRARLCRLRFPAGSRSRPLRDRDGAREGGDRGAPPARERCGRLDRRGECLEQDASLPAGDAGFHRRFRFSLRGILSGRRQLRADRVSRALDRHSGQPRQAGALQGLQARPGRVPRIRRTALRRRGLPRRRLRPRLGGFSGYCTAEIMPTYTHHTDAAIFNTSTSMDYILGKSGRNRS